MNRIRARRCRAWVVLLAALGAGCSKPPPPAAPVRPVLSVVVEPNQAQTGRIFTGTIEPRYRAQLGFRTGGRIAARNFNVGDLVTHGQVLAALDPTVPRLAIVSAEASLVSAQAQLVNAAAVLQRKQALVRNGDVSRSQVDAAIATRNIAQARVDETRSRLHKAREQLDYTALTSDYDGVIASWSAEVGQVVAAGQDAVTVARPDVRDAVFDMPDTLMDHFQPGSRFAVTSLADERLMATGVVREVAPQSDPGTLTRRVRLTLQDPPAGFRLGTTVRTRLAITSGSDIELPASAILDRDGRCFVWLVDARLQAAPRQVVLGARRGSRVVISSGLSSGERVITAGVHSLAEGQAVKLTEQ